MTEPLVETQTTDFIALGKTGRSAWWRYVLGAVIIFGGYFVLGTTLFVAVMVLANGGRLPKMDPQTAIAEGIDPFINFVALNIGFWFIVLFAYLVIRFLHGRSFLSLITPAAKIDFKRIGIGFILWLCLTSTSSILGAIIFPHDYKIALQSPEFFYYAPIVLFLTPIQCFSEEIFFRGYVLQAIGKLIKSPWLLSGISGICFAIPHFFNPEVAVDAVPVILSYFTIGFVLTFATVKTNSLEIAIGAHTANNLFDGLIVNYSNSVLTTRSIFLCTQMHPWYEFSTLAILGAVFCVAAERLVKPKVLPSTIS